MVTPATLYRRLPVAPATRPPYPRRGRLRRLPAAEHRLRDARGDRRHPEAIWAPIPIALFAATLVGLVALYG